MTQDGKGTGYSYSFDGENRLGKATGMTGGPYCYVYDGNGLRVAKKSGANSDCSGGTVARLYWRSIAGDAMAETDGSGNTTNAAYSEYVFFAGRRVASRNGSGGIFYWFADHLGSTRTITTGSGTGQTPGQLCYDADFTPYGQEISHSERLQTTACPPSYKFTGYERDPETAYGQTDTGLDYALARYYSSRLGRFLSTDPLGGAIGNLQSHNAYTYTVNNPLNLIDPAGMDGCPSNPNIPPGTICGPPPNVPYGGVCGGTPTCDPVGMGNGLSCSIDGVSAACSMALGLLQGDAAVLCPFADCTFVRATQGPGGTTIISQWVAAQTWTSGDDITGYIIHQIIGGWKETVIKTDQFGPSTFLGWDLAAWGTFAGTFGRGVLHGTRKPQQTFAACMDQNVKETTGGLIDPGMLYSKAAVQAETTAFALGLVRSQGGTYNGIQMAALGTTLAARGFGAGLGAARIVRVSVAGGGYGLAIAGAATAGLTIGSAFNCM